MMRWKRANGAHTGAGSIVAMLAAPEAWAARWPSLPAPTGVQIISVDDNGHPALDRPADYDRHLYRERHLVECFINKMKHYRRIFSRFEKLDARHLGFLHFTAALIWLR